MRRYPQKSRANGSAAIDATIPEGRRNDTLTSLAGTMRRRGIGAEEIEAASLVTNNKRCDPPLAEDEVRKIASSVCRYRPAEEGAFRLQALDFEASRTTALRPELGEYRIVHFATHGLLNNIHPELSGIVLSLVDNEGQQQDGFLRLQDIYNLKLQAELVVLSACQTGLGKEIKGEGLVGLTRGFMYAGAPRVVASLWKVDDRATSELMKRFYQGLLGPKRCARPGRYARLSCRSGKRNSGGCLNYWAAFVLQGEWK
jgi:CHAT domain-containing protein